MVERAQRNRASQTELIGHVQITAVTLEKVGRQRGRELEGPQKQHSEDCREVTVSHTSRITLPALDGAFVSEMPALTLFQVMAGSGSP